MTTEAGLKSVDLVLRVTLVALMLRPIGSGLLQSAVLALALLGLALPRVLRHPALWAGLAGLATIRVVSDWPLPDNHSYLLAYWYLAIAISLCFEQVARALALNGRLLIGLVFAFSALWKLLLSPDFVSGDFMRFTWLLDPRFEIAARVFGGMDTELMEQGRNFLLGEPSAPETLALPAAYLRATWASTLWTLFIEPLVALTFLLPARWSPVALGRARDASLLAFCATVYAFAPVPGFAWLLLAMGLAQVPEEGRRTRVAYLFTFVLILAYREVGWLGWLQS